MSSEYGFTTDKVVVQLDNDLREIVPQFLKNRYKDLETIEQAIQQDNFALIQMLGHRMKGSGGGYGFDFISDLGREIEQAAKQQNKLTIQQCRLNLASYLSRLEVVWRAA